MGLKGAGFLISLRKSVNSPLYIGERSVTGESANTASSEDDSLSLIEDSKPVRLMPHWCTDSSSWKFQKTKNWLRGFAKIFNQFDILKITLLGPNCIAKRRPISCVMYQGDELAENGLAALPAVSCASRLRSSLTMTCFGTPCILGLHFAH